MKFKIILDNGGRFVFNSLQHVYSFIRVSGDFLKGHSFRVTTGE